MGDSVNAEWAFASMTHSITDVPFRTIKWLTESVNPVLQGVLASIIVLVIPPLLVRIYKRRRRRALWKRLSSDKCAAVVADHSELIDQQPEWEESGLMAVGDARAYAYLASELHQLGIELQLNVSRDGSVADERDSDKLLIGGPDVNAATYRYMQEVSESLIWLPAAVLPESERHSISILDKESGRWYPPDPDSFAPEREDYGLITVTHSPFESNRWVVCVCGVYGSGTVAAATHTFDRQFISERLVKRNTPFQALVKATILFGVVKKTRLIAIRPVSEHSIDRNKDAGK
jgi:hypothetical protein